MSRKGIYHFFFPKGKDLPLKKFRWTCMVILQELRMCKFKAVFKYYVKPSYRKDIRTLRDILSKAPLKGTKSTLPLNFINFSHEINYPKWVDKLYWDYKAGVKPKRIKVFKHNDRWIVIDGNHRLKAMKEFYNSNKEEVEVLILEYR